MSRPRAESDDLPGGELEDILEADDERQRPSYNDSDEFDASALLSQPFFDDSNGDLDVDESEFVGIQASQAMASSGGTTNNVGSHMNTHQLQTNFQQQQQQQQNNFSSYNQSPVNQSSDQPIQGQMNIYSSGGGSPEPVESIVNRALSPEQTISLKMQEVQRKIQEVQNNIERAQLESSNTGMGGQMPQNALSSSQQKLPQGIQNNFDLQSMMNQGAVASRAPPGRSVSMPTRRNQMHGSPMKNRPTFMMQQPMHELQQQQAMMGNSQGSSMQNDMGNMQVFNQGPSMDQQQQQMMMGNVLDNSVNSPVNNMQNFVQLPTMDQQQAMMGGSVDVSVASAMNNMNLGVGVSMDGSMNSVMSNLQQGSMNNMQPQGFNLDNSTRSMPGNMPNNMGMDPTMLMMQQQQQQDMDNIMPNMVFGPDGQAIRQNSLPHSNSSNIAMMQGQPQNDLIGPTNFDLAQMQRAFQAQGLIPGPADSMQEQMGQPAEAGPQGGMSMEKLCESMRRSAMSRSMVKQLSGRSLSRANSGRGLVRAHSGRSLSRQNSGGIRKQLSGRNLSRANSGRQLQRSASGRQTMVDGGAELPVRRVGHQDSKHRIQRDGLSTSLHAPRRGVFRHKSQSAVTGDSNNKTVVNIVGNSIGMF
jgi:hypothetical protein